MANSAHPDIDKPQSAATDKAAAKPGNAPRPSENLKNQGDKLQNAVDDAAKGKGGKPR